MYGTQQDIVGMYMSSPILRTEDRARGALSFLTLSLPATNFGFFGLKRYVHSFGFTLAQQPGHGFLWLLREGLGEFAPPSATAQALSLRGVLSFFLFY